MSRSRRDLCALGVMLALSLHYFASARAAIDARRADPELASSFAASDSRHYIAIAHTLARGDFSMRHVAPTGGPDLAHRQPLYPALLAAAAKLGLSEPRGLALLNAALVVAAMWVAYATGVAVYASRAAGLAGALVLWRVPYLFESVTSRLLTEAGYIVVVLVLGLAFLRYRQTGEARWLYAAATAAALAYLQRVNGLLTGGLALLCLLVADLRRAKRAGVLVRHGFAALAFVLVTAPSWLPRALHAGDPLYHGYLANYFWVDEYARAHVPGPPRYSWRDYAREHDVAAAAARLRYGLKRAFYEAPREKYGSAAAVVMLAGVIATLVRRDSITLSWLAAGVLSVLPLAWTALSNPVRRIPATALLPFGVVAVCAGAASLVRAMERRK